MNSTVEATVASKITSKMLHGDTKIGQQYPYMWRIDIREAIPKAIESLADQAASIGDFTDEQIGTAFKDAVNAHKEDADHGNPLPFRMSTVYAHEMGAWLRAAYAEAIDAQSLGEPVVPVVGMRLRIDEALQRGTGYRIGDIVTVERAEPGDLYCRSEGGLGQWVVYSAFDPSQIVTDVPVVEQSEVARLEAEVARLHREVTTAVTHHEEDIAEIGEKLSIAAEQHSLCEVLEREVTGLNRVLHIPLVVERKSNRTVRYTGYIQVPYCYDVEIESTDDEDAYEQAREEQDSYLPSARDLLSNYADEYSAEMDGDVEIEVQ